MTRDWHYNDKQRRDIFEKYLDVSAVINADEVEALISALGCFTFDMLDMTVLALNEIAKGADHLKNQLAPGQLYQCSDCLAIYTEQGIKSRRDDEKGTVLFCEKCGKENMKLFIEKVEA